MRGRRSGVPGNFDFTVCKLALSMPLFTFFYYLGFLRLAANWEGIEGIACSRGVVISLLGCGAGGGVTFTAFLS
jgi:hypothetical protein